MPSSAILLSAERAESGFCVAHAGLVHGNGPEAGVRGPSPGMRGRLPSSEGLRAV